MSTPSDSALSPATPPPLRPGALVHGPGSHAVDALLERFAFALKRRGFRVGGVIQRNFGGGEHCAEQMELVDVATERRFGISQNLGRGSQSCRVDPTGVADASQALRRAVEERADLIVVNKFAGLEAHGGGLAHEMLTAIAEGIPLLTSVGSRFLNEWNAFTGGYGDLLSPDDEAVWRWWGPHRLYEDLVLGVEDAEVTRVVVGPKWILLETAEGRMGLTARPAAATGEPPPPEHWAGSSLALLAAQAARSWDPLEAAVGMAAVNAHYNRPDLEGEATNGLDRFAGGDGRVVVVGGFPQIEQRLPGALVVDMAPKPGQYPEAASEWLLPGADGAVVTASTLANRTLPRLLTAARGVPVALVGPGTPMTERLFDYGIHTLSGFVASDSGDVCRVILAGGSSRQFHVHGRFVTRHRPAGHGRG
ncbi:DUF2478 domain-containing protein [Azospirillum halopraeferens]|uniref:DUF2478 domain-containing protein n=1 Tax=Azospirillum halopraeferens TaxID=34010 RepID=UPI00040F376A|nr:DUF2478 domain-containing protein [Azospirillum halopraeferens]